MAITINVNLDEILAALKNDLDFTGNADKYIKVNATADGFEFAAVDTSGLVPYTGATTNVNLGEFGVNSGYLQFDLTPTNTPTSQGTAYWDDSAETVALIMNGTTQKVGEDTFYHVKNSTGVEIAKGTAVMFAGTDGASGKLLITPFLADGTYPSSYFMGITAEAIANGANGKVYHFGKMRSIDTSVYNDGDILYASTTSAGGFQTTKPSAPNNVISVAAVVNAGNNGTLMIRPIIEDSPTLDDVTTAGNTTTNSISVGGLTVDTDTLVVDATNNRVGILRTPTAYGLEIGAQALYFGNSYNGVYQVTPGALVYYNNSSLYFHTRTNSLPYGGGFKWIGALTANNPVQVAHMNQSGALYLGGTAAPSAQLHVNAQTTSTVGAIIQAAAGQTANLQEWKDSAGNVLASVSGGGNLAVDTDTLFVDATNNRVGIGTATPSQQFQIKDSSSTDTLSLYAQTNNGYIDFNSGNLFITASSVYNPQMQLLTSTGIIFNRRGSTEWMRIAAATGNVGINNSSPSAMLDIVSNATDKVGLEINAAAGQTANTFEIKDSGGNIELSHLIGNGLFVQNYSSGSTVFNGNARGSGTVAFELQNLNIRRLRILSNATSTTFESSNQTGGFIFNKAITPASLADASAQNNSIYYSTDASKLVYKDSSGTSNNLYDDGLIDINTQATSYTLVLADANKLVRMNVASANNLTIPPNSSVAFGVGTILYVEQMGAGTTTVVAGSGVTINTSAVKTPYQYGTITLIQVSADVWNVLGGTV